MALISRIPKGWDYWSIGTAGFYQVGDLSTKKQDIETQVIKELYKIHGLMVPEEFSFVANLLFVTHSHDAGDYKDYTIIYDRNTVEKWEEEEETNPKYLRFLQWATRCESFMGENTDNIIRVCRKMHTGDMVVVHRAINEVFKGLKIA